MCSLIIYVDGMPYALALNYNDQMISKPIRVRCCYYVDFSFCRNYVVQFVLELQLPWATVDILEQLEGNYGDLSVQKYSSNVVEKSLKYAGEERRTCIIQELIENMHLDHIMQDPYGNYVIQAALSQSKVSKLMHYN